MDSNSDLAIKALDAALALNRERVNSQYQPENADAITADAKVFWQFLTDPNN